MDKIKRVLALKGSFWKLHMCVYLRAKFHFYNIILTNFRHAGRRLFYPCPLQNEPLRSPLRLGFKDSTVGMYFQKTIDWSK